MKEKIKKLNEAMKVLKEECERHEWCKNCALHEKLAELIAAFDYKPEDYKLFEEADQ